MQIKHPRQLFLYTIGYEGRTLEKFAAWIKNFDISTLVDVRELPLSRKKGFSKTPLSKYLKEFNIEYLHLKKLGSPKSLRTKLRLDGDYTYFFEKYTLYIKSQMQIMGTLYRVTLKHTCCIMCYERSFEKCHRKVIAEEIKKFDGNGLVVRHI